MPQDRKKSSLPSQQHSKAIGEHSARQYSKGQHREFEFTPNFSSPHNSTSNAKLLLAIVLCSSLVTTAEAVKKITDKDIKPAKGIKDGKASAAKAGKPSGFIDKVDRHIHEDVPVAARIKIQNVAKAANARQREMIGLCMDLHDQHAEKFGLGDGFIGRDHDKSLATFSHTEEYSRTHGIAEDGSFAIASSTKSEKPEVEIRINHKELLPSDAAAREAAYALAHESFHCVDHLSQNKKFYIVKGLRIEISPSEAKVVEDSLAVMHQQDSWSEEGATYGQRYSAIEARVHKALHSVSVKEGEIIASDKVSKYYCKIGLEYLRHYREIRHQIVSAEPQQTIEMMDQFARNNGDAMVRLVDQDPSNANSVQNRRSLQMLGYFFLSSATHSFFGKINSADPINRNKEIGAHFDQIPSSLRQAIDPEMDSLAAEMRDKIVTQGRAKLAAKTPPEAETYVGDLREPLQDGKVKFKKVVQTPSVDVKAKQHSKVDKGKSTSKHEL